MKTDLARAGQPASLVALGDACRIIAQARADRDTEMLGKMYDQAQAYILVARQFNLSNDAMIDAFLLKALVVVFDEFVVEGKKPSTSYWTAHHAYFREHALPRLKQEWSALTRLDPALFPWSEDEVGITWEEWRKTNAQYRNHYRNQLGLPSLLIEEPA